MTLPFRGYHGGCTLISDGKNFTARLLSCTVVINLTGNTHTPTRVLLRKNWKNTETRPWAPFLGSCRAYVGEKKMSDAPYLLLDLYAAFLINGVEPYTGVLSCSLYLPDEGMFSRAGQQNGSNLLQNSVQTCSFTQHIFFVRILRVQRAPSPQKLTNHEPAETEKSRTECDAFRGIRDEKTPRKKKE